jgi:ubiquinone/menaquinone biosynthesis C-methylase UbiE
VIDVRMQVTPPAPRDCIPRFARWVAQQCSPDDRVLEVGAGDGRHPARLSPIYRRASSVVGVDPDAAVLDNLLLVERHHMTLEEFAPSHVGEFDVAFAIFVLEHVVQPTAFIQACAQVLKPGGKFFALTMNIYQYFGLVTWALSRVHLADPVLERLKGRAVMDGYHFPTEYRINSTRRLSTELDRAGFSTVEFRCFDQTERFQWYLPSSLQWFPPLYAKAAYALKAAPLMGHLSLCATKSLQPPAPVSK